MIRNVLLALVFVLALAFYGWAAVQVAGVASWEAVAGVSVFFLLAEWYIHHRVDRKVSGDRYRRAVAGPRLRPSDSRIRRVLTGYRP
jgi:hypothetical protein